MNKLNQKGVAHIILLVLVLIVVGVGIYLYSQGKLSLPGSGSATGTTTADLQDEKGPSEEATKAKSNNTLSIYLGSQNRSNEVGRAIITRSGKGVVVKVSVKSVSSSPQPAHIHVGSCPNPGAVKYPLNNLVNGTSETTLKVSLNTLKGSLPLAINVHKSQAESNVYVSCGDLKP